MVNARSQLRRNLLGGISAILVVGFGSPALAQSAPRGGTASTTDAPSEVSGTAQADDTGLEEIVVTAQKRSENLQNVPISITALTGESLENIQATSLQALQGSIPNTQINSNANTSQTAVFSIRGIGVVEADPFAGNTVTVVVDGVPSYFSYGALLDLFDVDRVEVLRGPQGTLFGANSTGGVINVVTAQPTGEFGGKVQAVYGNYNRLDLKAAVDFPVSDVLAGKVAALHTSRDGFYRSIVNGERVGGRNVTALRGYLKLEPSADFDATLIGEYARSRNGTPVVVNGAVPGEVGYVPTGTIFPGVLLPMYPSACPSVNERCQAAEEYLYGGTVADKSNMDNYRATLTMNIRNTAVGDIASVTGYRDFKVYEHTDHDSLPLSFINTLRQTQGWQLSQELRTAFSVSDRLNLLVGGFYMKTHYDHYMNLTLDFAAPGLRQFGTQDQDNWSISAFAQGYWNITDSLRLQAGIRYTHERTKMVAQVDNFLNPSGPAFLLVNRPGPAGDIFVGGFGANGSESWDNLGWKIGIDYQANRDLLFYGYYARGFKSGGFMGRIGIPQDLGPYDPETVDTFEAGIKADWLNRRVRTNLSAFYTKYRDMQVAQPYLLQTPDGIVQGSTIMNAASATIKGFEAEVVAIPVEGLTINGSAAYLDATYDEFLFGDVVLGQRDLSGFRLQNSPKWSASLGATYEFAVANGTMSAHAQYNYVGQKYLLSVVNSPRSSIQPMNLVNARLDWTPASARWSIGAWANNLFDKRYVAFVQDQPGLYAQVAFAPPLEFGVDFRFNW
ncbi:TonB-dependent receptor [Sphingosinicella rhizophila]|uniref:TonB-dependent receptor n=1 Tax=Sphingosinicella rhizophila TaxID=3050082 RepID=A0ABU3QC15_9SPHN|nr:TonB-dependent receptor [Sphingosinicella sp. GR2756]MDT9600538.1 TonB-dependent receptor [Sphingosinicella sp. GR2756]